jgi:hypothetical protein
MNEQEFELNIVGTVHADRSVSIKIPRICFTLPDGYNTTDEVIPAFTHDDEWIELKKKDKKWVAYVG